MSRLDRVLTILAFALGLWAMVLAVVAMIAKVS